MDKNNAHFHHTLPPSKLIKYRKTSCIELIAADGISLSRNILIPIRKKNKIKTKQEEKKGSRMKFIQ